MQPSGGPNETRNIIIFFVLAAVVYFGWDLTLGKAQRERLAAEHAQSETQHQQQQQQNAANEPELLTRDQALTRTAAERVPIGPADEGGREHGDLDGTILLQGARFDDLSLRAYRQTLAKDSPEVALFTPNDAAHGFDAFMGWQDRDPGHYGVGEKDVWTAPEGARLTPQSPLTLSYDTGDGVRIKRTITLDDHYMFTIADDVTNVGAASRDMRPFGTVRRMGFPEHYRRLGVVHEGLVGVFGPKLSLQESRYEDAQKHARKKAKGEAGEAERILELQGQGGWLGITDHYWLAAISVDADERMSGYFDARPGVEADNFRAAYTGDWRSIAPGQTITYTQRLFAGAKRVELLRAYEHDLSIPKFDSAVDWGRFWFLTRPLFWLVDYLGKFTGNFGLGILLTTVVIRTCTFPLVYQSYKMAAKMRAVAPKMKEIQERYAADKQRQQQEVLKLYQAEKVNPVSGCLPMFLQIPVFFALYKTLTVTIEMRHAPFFGWIHDLSAPDPTSLFNLFGLLPYDPSSIPVLGGFLMIGVWPLLYGLSMWGTQALSPPPADEMQAQIFRLLPIVFTFMFSSFAAGLVIYYTWSNMLTTAQQYVIMRRQGVETQVDKLIAKYWPKTPPAPAE